MSQWESIWITEFYLPPKVPEPKLFSIFAEKFLIDSADSLMILCYITRVVEISIFCFTRKQ